MFAEPIGGLICKLDSQALVEQLKSAHLQLHAKITLVISGTYGGDPHSTFTRSGILYVIDCPTPLLNTIIETLND